jgi:hypothetical protein
VLARLAIVAAAALACIASVWADVDAPAATPLYGSCITTAECVRSVEECVHGVTSDGESLYGICTIACEDDAGCPNGGTCREQFAGRKVCARTCGTAPECESEHLSCPAGACIPAQ